MRPDDLASVHDMVDRAFQDTPRSFFDTQVAHDPFLRPEDTLILLESGRIRASVRVFYRDVLCGGKPVRMGGIGDVATDPDSRGHGFSSMLMERALQKMTSEGAFISFLFTRINPFYERFGYMTLPLLELDVEFGGGPGETLEFGGPAVATDPVSSGSVTSAGPSADHSGFTLRDADLEKDLPAMMHMYEQFTQSRSGPVIRPRVYWERQVHLPRLENAAAMVAETDKPAAFVRGAQREDAFHVIDFAHLPGGEAALRDLVRRMAGRFGTKKVRFLSVAEKEAELFRNDTVITRPNTHLMIRMIDKDRTSELKPLFEPRSFLYYEADRF